MKRDFTTVLEKWASKPDRKPLVIRGMRQTGKTWCVREFASRRFPGRFCEIDFEFAKGWRSVFKADLDPIRICRELELLAGTDIRAGETLLFFDEVQLCPRALESLRYFCEKMPALHVVAAGSLLGRPDLLSCLDSGRRTAWYLRPGRPPGRNCSHSPKHSRCRARLRALPRREPAPRHERARRV